MKGFTLFFGIFSLYALGTFHFIYFFFCTEYWHILFLFIFFSVPNIDTFYHFFFHNVAGVAVGAALATI